uniref:Mob1/phocein family n=1 Tax=Ascaris lumbricoides TaxID=6252 RepID=A0A0M3HMT5_ASCLU
LRVVGFSCFRISNDGSRNDCSHHSASSASCCHKLRASKTFRPKKRFPVGTLRYNLHKQAQATLHSGVDLRAAVRLPANENFDDWLAVHTVDFFNRINLLYGTIADVCTAKSCPTMSGGPRYEYLWQDGVNYKKPTRLPAPDYIYLLMDWIEIRINDETIFPSNTAVPFPRDFRQICKKILTRLFRVFVHVYIHHFDRLSQLGAEPHANTLYKHFYFFITEYAMVSSKELDALSFCVASAVVSEIVEEGDDRTTVGYKPESTRSGQLIFANDEDVEAARSRSSSGLLIRRIGLSQDIVWRPTFTSR